MQLGEPAAGFLESVGTGLAAAGAARHGAEQQARGEAEPGAQHAVQVL